MSQDLINRYQAGGDIYAKLVTLYGQPAADAIAAAALTGDETQVNAAITKAKFGAPLDTSVADIFAQQILTDPLGAPIESANTVLGKTFWDFFKAPFVVGLVILTLYFLGPQFFKRKAKA